MSWMDSWSRPSKHAVIPPPSYLLPGGEATPYCRSCGRVISSRKTQTLNSKPVVKYCSERCRHQKPRSLDRQIEATFVALLNGLTPPKSTTIVPGSEPPPEEDVTSQIVHQKKKKTKGEPRVIVSCSTVEVLVFGSRHDPEKVFGRKKNRVKRWLGNDGDWKSVDMEGNEDPAASTGGVETDSEDNVPAAANGSGGIDSTNFGAGKVRPPQSASDVNGSVGGEKGWAERAEETEETISKRKEGQKWAERKEMVRSAARRGCAVGFVVGEETEVGDKAAVPKKKNKKALADKAEDKLIGQQEKRRKCEAVMNDSVVEASFAKGEWGIRWRE